MMGVLIMFELGPTVHSTSIGVQIDFQTSWGGGGRLKAHWHLVASAHWLKPPHNKIMVEFFVQLILYFFTFECKQYFRGCVPSWFDYAIPWIAS